RLLIVIMSLPGMMTSSFKRGNHNPPIGHFYLANIGHYHLAVTPRRAAIAACVYAGFNRPGL
ncbi:MAG: hypothetical protein M0022_10775, partial [Desulfobacteraceae bacterium]|nr:hypothetical protein [Desulfobacteraceae bacterium]